MVGIRKLEEVHERGGGRRVEVAQTDYDVAESREYPEFTVHAACSAAVTVALQRLLSLHGEAIAVPLLVWAGVASASVAFEINMSEFNACQAHKVADRRVAAARCRALHRSVSSFGTQPPGDDLRYPTARLGTYSDSGSEPVDLLDPPPGQVHDRGMKLTSLVEAAATCQRSSD